MLEEMAYVTDADRTPYLQLWNPLPHPAALGLPFQCSVLISDCLSLGRHPRAKLHWDASEGRGGEGDRR